MVRENGGEALELGNNSCAVRCGADHACVLGKVAGRHSRGQRLPLCSALFKLFLAHEEIDVTLNGVVFDDVAVLDKADGAAECGFGRDMADDRAGSDTGETAVGDECGALSQTCRSDGGCEDCHFGHTGCALGAAVAQDDDVAGLYLAGLDGGGSIGLAVKAARDAAELAHFIRAASYFEKFEQYGCTIDEWENYQELVDLFAPTWDETAAQIGGNAPQLLESIKACA